MVNEDIWNEIIKGDLLEKTLLEISKKYKIPMSFITGRLAKTNKIEYGSFLYKK